MQSPQHTAAQSKPMQRTLMDRQAVLSPQAAFPAAGTPWQRQRQRQPSPEQQVSEVRADVGRCCRPAAIQQLLQRLHAGLQAAPALGAVAQLAAAWPLHLVRLLQQRAEQVATGGVCCCCRRRCLAALTLPIL